MALTMPRFGRFHLQSKPSGFSLPEVLVVVMILGITAAVGVPGLFFLVRRARVNSVALEAAGWIESVRNAAADNVSNLDNEGGCQLTFTPAAGMAARSQLADVDPQCTNLAIEPTLLIPDTVQQDTVTITSVGDTEVIRFTPRGLWTNAAGVTGVGFELQITLDDGGPLRCVRVSPTLGSVDIGRPNTFAGNACDNYELL
jgi:prepilin-type N-terminal cleavage/methylation domain-containing protein